MSSGRFYICILFYLPSLLYGKELGSSADFNCSQQEKGKVMDCITMPLPPRGHYNLAPLFPTISVGHSIQRTGVIGADYSLCESTIWNSGGRVQGGTLPAAVTSVITAVAWWGCWPSPSTQPPCGFANSDRQLTNWFGRISLALLVCSLLDTLQWHNSSAGRSQLLLFSR